MSADLYAAPQHVGLTHVAQVAPEATLAAPGGRSMQDRASELPRIPLPRTWVNRPSSDPNSRAIMGSMDDPHAQPIQHQDPPTSTSRSLMCCMRPPIAPHSWPRRSPKATSKSG